MPLLIMLFGQQSGQSAYLIISISPYFIGLALELRVKLCIFCTSEKDIACGIGGVSPEDQDVLVVSHLDLTLGSSFLSNLP